MDIKRSLPCRRCRSLRRTVQRRFRIWCTALAVTGSEIAAAIRSASQQPVAIGFAAGAIASEDEDRRTA
jgi:hypothetical protein